MLYTGSRRRPIDDIRFVSGERAREIIDTDTYLSDAAACFSALIEGGCIK